MQYIDDKYLIFRHKWCAVHNKPKITQLAFES